MRVLVRTAVVNPRKAHAPTGRGLDPKPEVSLNTDSDSDTISTTMASPSRMTNQPSRTTNFSPENFDYNIYINFEVSHQKRILYCHLSACLDKECINVSMCYCVNVLLYQCITVSMYDCVNVPLYQCINVSMYQ